MDNNNNENLLEAFADQHRKTTLSTIDCDGFFKFGEEIEKEEPCVYDSGKWEWGECQ